MSNKVYSDKVDNFGYYYKYWIKILWLLSNEKDSVTIIKLG